jgi:hypothetical protein
LTLNPVDDGWVWVGQGGPTVPDCCYVETGAVEQGIVKFSTATIPRDFDRVLFSVNPYATPVFAINVSVYGYGTIFGQLHVSDANRGTLLGTLVLPADLGNGQDAFFDVTTFLRAFLADPILTPYVAFNLRVPAGFNVFSSIAYGENYGHGSQLIVTVPEPAPAVLLLAALVILSRIRASAGV